MRIGIPIFKNVATTKIILTLSNLLLKRGHQVQYFTVNQQNDLEQDYQHPQIPIIRLPLQIPQSTSFGTMRLTKYRNLRTLIQNKTQLNIDCLVTCNDTSPFTSALVLYSRICKIPTIYYQEGSLGVSTLSGKQNTLKFLRKAKSYLFDAVMYRRYGFQFHWFYALGLDCDYVFVYGTAAQKYYEKFFEPNQVKLVGSVMMDHAKTVTSLKSNTGNRILYPLQISVKFQSPESLAHEIVKIATTITQAGYWLLIKSRKDFDKVDAILRTELSDLLQSNQIQLQTEGDAVDLLDEVDGMIVASSTVAYYALLKGIPIIQLNYMDTGTELDFYQYGASIPVFNAQDLPAALHDALQNETKRIQLFQGMQQAIERHLYRLDGKSGERFVQAVEQIVRSH